MVMLLRNLVRDHFSSNALFATWTVLGLCCVGMIMGIGGGIIPTQVVDTWFKVGLLALPFFLFGSLHLYMMYKAWFKTPRTGISGMMKTIFWGALLLAFVAVVVLFSHFVMSK